MKKSTVANKLNELLGIHAKIEEVKTKSTGRVVEITEDQIQTFREAQGLIYFLQAPALFTPKICKHCGAAFVVSRLYVAFCSYTCIEKSLEELGIRWSRRNDIEALINEIYEGNEPLWIRSPHLEKLHAITSKLLSQNTGPLSSVTSQSHGALSTSPAQAQGTKTVDSPSLSAPSVTTPPPTPLEKSTTTKRNKPGITFVEL